MREVPMFDLQDVIVLLQKAVLTARRLDAALVPVDDVKGRQAGNPAVAAANREIQYLMHLCARTEAEVASVYWRSRGFSDPLDTEGDT